MLSVRLIEALEWSKERAKDMDQCLPSEATRTRLESNRRAFGDGCSVEYPPFDFSQGLNFSNPPWGVRNSNKAPTPTAQCKKANGATW